MSPGSAVRGASSNPASAIQAAQRIALPIMNLLSTGLGTIAYCLCSGMNLDRCNFSTISSPRVDI